MSSSQSLLRLHKNKKAALGTSQLLDTHHNNTHLNYFYTETTLLNIDTLCAADVCAVRERMTFGGVCGIHWAHGNGFIQVYEPRSPELLSLWPADSFTHGCMMGVEQQVCNTEMCRHPMLLNHMTCCIWHTSRTVVSVWRYQIVLFALFFSDCLFCFEAERITW